jgi:pimeloyl-ACP methyl ester carboxylesterase
MSIIFNPTSGRNDTVILLVHGWENNASRWEKILPYLQKSEAPLLP